jgi:AmiR/NasT family two-component response regulator
MYRALMATEASVVDGYAKHRLLSIIQVARARFRHEQVLKDELSGLSQRFEERKLVDRAKGVLMRSRGVTQDKAFELLRNLAMRSRQRIVDDADALRQISDASERLLDVVERLTDQYEQAMQVLIGDRLGRMS